MPNSDRNRDNVQTSALNSPFSSVGGQFYLGCQAVDAKKERPSFSLTYDIHRLPPSPLSQKNKSKSTLKNIGKGTLAQHTQS